MIAESWLALGSGLTYMICVTLFCTLSKSKNLLPCKNGMRFLNGSRFFDLHNVQKHATKSDTSGHCLAGALKLLIDGIRC